MSKDNILEEQKQSGKGTGSKSRNLFKDTISRALLENDSKRLRALVEKALYFAEHDAIQVNDFITILKFLADRVDGRPAQAVEITDNSINLPSAGQFKIVKIEPQGEQ